MNNLTGLILAVTVGVISIGLVLMPILTAATATTDTFENNGYFQMEKYTTEEVSMSYDGTYPTIVNVNGDSVPLPDVDLSVSIFASDICCLRYNADGTFQFFSGNSNTHADVDEDWTLSAVDGTVTFTNTTTSSSRTAEYENIYVISNDGVWTMKKSDVSAYMNGDSFFMGVGLTSGSSAIGIVGLNVSGNVEDGAEIVAWRGSGLTFDDVILVAETIDTHIDLYALDKVTFTATNSDDASLDITYSYFIVPSDVTAEKSVHMDSMSIGVVMMIPIIMILAVLMIAVRGLTRYD